LVCYRFAVTGNVLAGESLNVSAMLGCWGVLVLR
jgi:hypothetical protein